MYVVTLKHKLIRSYQIEFAHLLLIVSICIFAMLLRRGIDVVVVRREIIDQVVVVRQLLVILSLHFYFLSAGNIIN